MKKTYLSVAAAALIVLGACTLAACETQTEVSTAPAASNPAAGPLSADSAPGSTITVNSSEKVTVVPDIAEIVYSVQTEAADSAGCQQKNTEDVDKVVALLTELGVKEGSIQTTGYYMNPRYNWSGDERTLIGYEAVTTLTVSDLPLDQVGGILAQSVSAGINNIQSISYLSSKYDESYQEALGLAITAARTKAESMAQAAGCKLGEISALNERSTYSEARYTDNALADKTSMRAASMDAGDVTIMPGELEVEASVIVEYSLLPGGSAE
ncbi:SIMPL domain-containing protein [Eisenbergiella sp.]